MDYLQGGGGEGRGYYGTNVQQHAYLQAQNSTSTGKRMQRTHSHNMLVHEAVTVCLFCVRVRVRVRVRRVRGCVSFRFFPAFCPRPSLPCFRASMKYGRVLCVSSLACSIFQCYVLRVRVMKNISLLLSLVLMRVCVCVCCGF